MNAFLMIQNPGVADESAFTLLGASTSRHQHGAIGKFGSGNKMGVGVCIRAGVSPTVFAGNLKMTFLTRVKTVDNGRTETEFQQMQVRFGGKDRKGVSRSATEDLGYVLEYGASDWDGVDLALREFVSNAIDRSVLEGEQEFVSDYFADREITPEAKQQAKQALAAYRKTATDYSQVVVTVVDASKVRALAGHTRVFVPLSEAVLKFYNNLHKWFLHFGEPGMLHQTLLPKTNRNLTDRRAAVIYRRGVRVREFESTDTESIFDYNLDDLPMDESRKVDDWNVRHAAARAMLDAPEAQLSTLLHSFTGSKAYWEHGFDAYGLQAGHADTKETLAARAARWQQAAETAYGTNAIFSTPASADHIRRKGYQAIVLPEAFFASAGSLGMRTPDRVLSQDDRDGRTVIEASSDAQEAVDRVWTAVVAHDMASGKQKPPVQCFSQVMEAGGQLLGFYRDGTVYLNRDIATGQSQQLLVTALEEVAHYVTGATDNSRDFQDYCLNLAVRLMGHHQ